MGEKKIDLLEERRETIQEVIDRHIKYGNKYTEALKRFNLLFPLEDVKKSSTLTNELSNEKNTQSSVGETIIRVYKTY